MGSLKIFDLVRKRVLVTRSSARELESDLADALVEGDGEVTLDFAGVDGLTPSFLDEILSVLEEAALKSGGSQLRIEVTNSPTQLSSKFAAVGRGHGLVAREFGDRTWIISNHGKNC